MMFKIFASIGSINALISVMLGAFGAHVLKSRLSSDLLETFHTGVEYHFYHALGLLIIALMALHYPDSAWLKWSGWLMFTGIVVFSGSLYILSITGIKWLGAITPIGGTAFIVAWILLTVAVLKG